MDSGPQVRVSSPPGRKLSFPLLYYFSLPSDLIVAILKYNDSQDSLGQEYVQEIFQQKTQHFASYVKIYKLILKPYTS